MKSLPLLALLLWFLTAPVYAQTYLEVSPAYARVGTPAASTHPWLADLRLGYAASSSHQFELAVMAGAGEDRLNQLEVEIPSVVSLFYHFQPELDSTLKLQLIAGISQVSIDSRYADSANSSEQYQGVSFGIGFEEAFRFNPDLKVSLDWIRLYQGENLDIDVISLGLHYDF